SRMAKGFGPSKLTDVCISAVQVSSDWLHRMELRDLRDRITTVLVATALLLALGIISRGVFTAPVGELHWDRVPQGAALVVTAGAALATLRAREHLSVVLILSFVGYGLALSFAIAGAPDLALVLVLVETLFTLLFLAVLWQVRPASLQAARRLPPSHAGPWPGFVSGLTVFFLAWFALGSPQERTVAWPQVRLT